MMCDHNLYVTWPATKTDHNRTNDKHVPYIITQTTWYWLTREFNLSVLLASLTLSRKLSEVTLEYPQLFWLSSSRLHKKPMISQFLVLKYRVKLFIHFLHLPGHLLFSIRFGDKIKQKAKKILSPPPKSYNGWSLK